MVWHIWTKPCLNVGYICLPLPLVALAANLPSCFLVTDFSGLRSLWFKFCIFLYVLHVLALAFPNLGFVSLILISLCFSWYFCVQPEIKACFWLFSILCPLVATRSPLSISTICCSRHGNNTLIILIYYNGSGLIFISYYLRLYIPIATTLFEAFVCKLCVKHFICFVVSVNIFPELYSWQLSVSCSGSRWYFS